MKKLIIAGLLVSPMVSYAAALGGITTLIGEVQGVVAILMPLMIALAALLFFWGLVKYISNASDEAAKEGAKTLMIWGILAIVVMVSLWGIVGWIQDNTGVVGSTIDTGTVPVMP